jgi:hypothetical protein
MKISPTRNMSSLMSIYITLPKHLSDGPYDLY